MNADLAKNIFNDANNSHSMFVKLKADTSLAENHNTPSVILKSIISTAISEINNDNIIWLNVLKLAANNPNLPLDQIHTLISMPSCDIKKILINNKAVSLKDIDILQKDSDHSVRVMAKERLNSER